MIKINWNIVIKLISVLFAFILGIILIQKYISDQITIRTQIIQEVYEKEKADIKLKLEFEKNELEKKLKLSVVEIESQLNSCKLDLETFQNKIIYKEWIKKDPKFFNKKVDSVLGVKGKKK